jgi:hypothetical protein
MDKCSSLHGLFSSDEKKSFRTMTTDVIAIKLFSLSLAQNRLQCLSQPNLQGSPIFLSKARAYLSVVALHSTVWEDKNISFSKNALVGTKNLADFVSPASETEKKVL